MRAAPAPVMGAGAAACLRPVSVVVGAQCDHQPHGETTGQTCAAAAAHCEEDAAVGQQCTHASGADCRSTRSDGAAGHE